MQAIRIHRHGPPEVLQVEEAPTPVCAASEALVRVKACALNHLDLFVRQGMPGVTVGLPRICGSDIAGELAALPAEAPQGFALPVGARVIVAPGVGCGACPQCLDGRDNECRFYAVMGYGRDGGYAEYVAVPARSLLPMPPGWGFTEAAAFPLVFLTAWNMLVRRAGIKFGQTVLVWGAGSGVGTAAIQIASLFGCRIIATASAAQQKKAQDLGVEAVVDHYDPGRPVAAAVRALAPEGVDIVFDHVGKASWAQSLRALARGGTLVTCGATTGGEAELDLRHLFARQLRLIGSYMGRRADLDVLLALAAKGRLRPVVDRVFAWPEAAAAHTYLAEGHPFGKVVLAGPGRDV